MANRKKILFIITQSEVGGAQRYVLDLISHLPTHLFQFYIASGGEGKFLGQAEAAGAKIFKLKYLIREVSKPWRDLLAVREIYKLCKSMKPDVVHLNSSKAGAVGALGARLAGVPKIVYTVHGFVFNEPLPLWRKAAYIIIEKITGYFKDHLICVSEKDCASGLKWRIAPRKKIITIHNGIYPIKFTDPTSAAERIGVPVDKKVIGTIANLYPAKGIVYLIEAAELVLKKHPDVVFVVIGSGMMADRLNALIAEKGIGKNFIMTGQVEQAYRYLTAFDIFTLPSVKEGFPYAILEAMTAGLPIVATSVGGVTELIDHGTNGLLVKPGQPVELAEALDRLLENEDLAVALATQANIDVGIKFSFHSMLSKTEKIYLS